jgi:hypothetical protein
MKKEDEDKIIETGLYMFAVPLLAVAWGGCALIAAVTSIFIPLVPPDINKPYWPKRR